MPSSAPTLPDLSLMNQPKVNKPMRAIYFNNPNKTPATEEDVQKLEAFNQQMIDKGYPDKVKDVNTYFIFQ